MVMVTVHVLSGALCTRSIRCNHDTDPRVGATLDTGIREHLDIGICQTGNTHMEDKVSYANFEHQLIFTEPHVSLFLSVSG